jgi:hypothetical protein
VWQQQPHTLPPNTGPVDSVASTAGGRELQGEDEQDQLADYQRLGLPVFSLLFWEGEGFSKHNKGRGGGGGCRVYLFQEVQKYKCSYCVNGHQNITPNYQSFALEFGPLVLIPLVFCN